MKPRALCASFLMFSPIIASAFTLPGIGTGPHAPQTAQLKRCDDWSGIVKEIALARDHGQAMSAYLADLHKAGVDLSDQGLQLIQRIYNSKLSSEDATAQFKKDCYATVLQAKAP